MRKNRAGDTDMKTQGRTTSMVTSSIPFVSVVSLWSYGEEGTSSAPCRVTRRSVVWCGPRRLRIVDREL